MSKLFAVIGDPIAHSMSPWMHNDLFSFYKIAAHYEAIRIHPDDLKKDVMALKQKGIAGFNVTIPHKRTIMPLLDRIDPLADAIGAVNTVVNENGMFVGYNTDGIGYIQGLREKAPQLLHKKVLIIGAGGAARAIYFSLAKEGVTEIDIANRTLDRARSLVLACPYSVHSNVRTVQEAEDCAGDYDIIIQTTSVGMSPQTNNSPFTVKHIRKGTIVSDIIYNPLETKLLIEAKKQGAVTQNGLPMFVYQGAFAFEKWTGIFPDVQRMKQHVLARL